MPGSDDSLAWCSGVVAERHAWIRRFFGLVQWCGGSTSCLDQTILWPGAVVWWLNVMPRSDDSLAWCSGVVAFSSLREFWEKGSPTPRLHFFFFF